MPDISSIKLPDNSSYNVKAKKIFYAECSTAKSDVAKVVTCSGFALEAGAMIAIRFTDTTTTTPTFGNITLNINNTGAKNIVPKGNNSVYSYGWSRAFCNNQTWLFMYNGTYFVCMNQDNNTTYNDATTSAHGLLSVADKKALDVLKTPYATCATARSTAAKVATLANFTLAIGTTIAVKFTATDTTNPTSGYLTLNVNGTGAKNIGFCRNGSKAAFNYSSAGYFYNNAIHIFTYDGTYWLCMDWNPDNNTTYSNMTAATASAAGKAGLVPAPAAGKNTAFLRGDGTWVIPTDSKVTSVGNHYTPAKSTTKSASGGTVTDITNLTSGTQVVTGVEMDAKGHVTGVTSVALKSTDTKVSVDSALSGTSTNPVQNKVINSALAGKAAASHSHTISQISDFPASLPANGGNADTVGGKNASDFVEALTSAQITNARVLIPDNVDVVNWLLTNAKIGGLYYRTANSTGQTNLPNLTNTSWAWFTYDGNRYLARVMIDNHSTRDFLLNMVNKVGGWKEISTTPIKSTTFSANVNNIGNFTLWSLSEKKVPISIQLDNTTFYAVPFLYINRLWMGSTIHEATRQPVINTAVSGTIYYIDI